MSARGGKPRMRNFGTLALLALVCGCSHPTGDSWKPIAIIEVPVRTYADHHDLVAIMRRMAVSNGMHVDDDSEKWIAFENSQPPKERNTAVSIYVGIWRGSQDDDLEAGVSDMFHVGRAWVSFYQGGHVDFPADKREQVLAGIMQRWHDARLVPILPSGAEPLAEDLRLTSGGYKIAASAGPNYGLPPNSPILVHD